VREKELRIALVCFGGVSLAIYMHGISKEILKLARASSAVHAITDRAKRRAAHFFDLRDQTDPEYDTEAVYFDLLRDIGRMVELRVVIDIIAGASAGGINATMLARALSHDLPMGRLRDLWLDKADVTELLAPDARARRWSKWFLRPFFWAAGLTRGPDIRDREVRQKLSLLMRSRWFKPPFDGSRMAALMYDGLTAMGAPRGPGATLLPSGQRLDLFVTVTDFYGCQQLMQIHDPPVVHEREHRHVLHFAFRRHAGNGADSDFGLADAPALAFAARATSSLPGAFPPARIVEIDELMRARSVAWPGRADFIARNFEPYAQVKVDAAAVPFVDGSVLNSRPFSEAIRAIRGRPAFREVDRRVVYIDPNPAAAGMLAHQRGPGFFATLKGALSDIPLAEPVTDELTWIARINEHARRLRSIVDSARPRVSGLVEDVMALGPGEAITEARIRAWRSAANAKAARDAGFAYEAYVRLKLAAVRSFVAGLIMDIRGVRAGSPFARAIGEIVDAWAACAGATFTPSATLPTQAAPGADRMPGWIAFLLALDVDYRRRRLYFLIEGQNRIYQKLGAPGFEHLDGGGRRAQALVLRLRRCAGQARRRRRRRRADAQPRRGDLPGAALARRHEGHRAFRPRLCRGAQGAARPAGRAHRRDHRSAGEHARHRRPAGGDRRLAAACAAGGAGELPRLSVLGRADLAGDAMAGERRVQRDPGRPHQRPGRVRHRPARRLSAARFRLQPVRGVSLARVSRERLPARPPACLRPPHRHRVRCCRRGCAHARPGGRAQTRCSAAHSRGRGTASAHVWRDDRTAARRARQISKFGSFLPRFAHF
jgi:patatin-related protein